MIMRNIYRADTKSILLYPCKLSRNRRWQTWEDNEKMISLAQTEMLQLLHNSEIERQ